MKVKLELDGCIFEREIEDVYYETIRDLLEVFSRHTFKKVEQVA